MQLYQPYEEKILKIAAIKAKILKYKYLILACLFVILCAIATLMYFKGHIRKDIVLQQQYAYGDEIAFDGKAFLADVSIEYYQGENKIDYPIYPGSYKARAVARGAFGVKKHGKWHAFLLVPKVTSVSIAQSVTYGEKPSIFVGELVNGDTVNVQKAQWTYTDVLTQSPKVEIIQGTFAVYNQEQQDVTICYDFQQSIYGKRDIIITPRPITVKTDGIKKEYDDTPTSCETYQITDGSLAYQDKLQAGNFPVLLGAGQVLNQPQFTIINKDKENVTSLYAINVQYGTINVTPRQITITTADDQKMHDGQPFPTPSYQVEGLLEGHRIEVSSSCTATQSGIYENKLNFDIKDGSGTSVKGNYNVTENWGALTVYQEKVIVTVSGQKTYDGTTNAQYTVKVLDGVLGPGESIEIIKVRTYDGDGAEKPLLDAGEYRVEIIEYKAHKAANAPPYLIQVQDGTFTVNPRKITVQLKDKEKYYDREELSSTQTTVDNLVSGHQVRVESVGSITNPGKITNVLKSVAVLDAQGNDVTKNYQITKKDGTLSVYKRKVTVYPLPIVKTYDAQPIAYPSAIPAEQRAYVEWTNKKDPLIDGNALLDGDYLQTDNVWIENVITNVGKTNVYVQGKILYKDGTADNGAYYQVTIGTGKAEIKPMTLQIRSLSHKKIYDGTALEGKAEDCYIAIGTLQNNETITFTVQASQTDVGKCANAITQVEVKAGNVVVGYAKFNKAGQLIEGNTAAYNYTIVVTNGTLEIQTSE